MNRNKRVTKRPTYQAAVVWIAHNDNDGMDVTFNTNEREQCIQNISEYISTLLVAELFGAKPEVVAADIFRVRWATHKAEAEKQL